MEPIHIYLIYILALSLVTFCFYGVDKYKAINGSWRIPEKTLLLLSFLGGAVGGVLAMNVVRHKTRKWYFWFVNVVGIFWQAAVLLWLLI